MSIQSDSDAKIIEFEIEITILAHNWTESKSKSAAQWC